jgi:hypothetical protein
MAAGAAGAEYTGATGRFSKDKGFIKYLALNSAGVKSFD